MTDRKTYEQELRERAERQKYLDGIVAAAMKRVIASIGNRKPTVNSHFFYGASAIHERHLVTWYLFRTDTEWDSAKQSGLVSDIEQMTRAELLLGGYTPEGAQEMNVSFTSEEDIQRKTGGDYRAYFQ